VPRFHNSLFRTNSVVCRLWAKPPACAPRHRHVETVFGRFGTVVAFMFCMALTTYKTVEVTTLHSNLTPCILDDDPSERDSLTSLISDMGYEAIPTGDAEEALRLIRSGHCQLVLAIIHLEGPEPYDFLDRALRCDPPCGDWAFSVPFRKNAANLATRARYCHRSLGISPSIPSAYCHRELCAFLQCSVLASALRWGPPYPSAPTPG
jgi:CheY-like chemotaxis protein